MLALHPHGQPRRHPRLHRLQARRSRRSSASCKSTARAKSSIYFVTVIAIVAEDLLTGVIVGFALSILKLLVTFSHLNVRIEDEPRRGRTYLYLEGAATFLRLPRLAARLDAVPRRPRAARPLRAARLHRPRLPRPADQLGKAARGHRRQPGHRLGKPHRPLPPHQPEQQWKWQRPQRIFERSRPRPFDRRSPPLTPKHAIAQPPRPPPCSLPSHRRRRQRPAPRRSPSRPLRRDGRSGSAGDATTFPRYSPPLPPVIRGRRHNDRQPLGETSQLPDRLRNAPARIPKSASSCSATIRDHTSPPRRAALAGRQIFRSLAAASWPSAATSSSTARSSASRSSPTTSTASSAGRRFGRLAPTTRAPGRRSAVSRLARSAAVRPRAPANPGPDRLHERIGRALQAAVGLARRFPSARCIALHVDRPTTRFVSGELSRRRHEELLDDFATLASYLDHPRSPGRAAHPRARKHPPRHRRIDGQPIARPHSLRRPPPIPPHLRPAHQPRQPSNSRLRRPRARAAIAREAAGSPLRPPRTLARQRHRRRFS